MKFSSPLIALAFLLLAFGCGPEPETEDLDSPVLPDTLHTTEQLTQFGLAQLYGAWNFELARAAFEKAIAVAPNNALANAHLGWYFDLANEPEKAKAQMEKSRAMEPGNPQWHTFRAFICLNAKDYPCMEESLREAEALDPSFSETYYTRGLMYLEQGRLEEALASEQIAARDPKWKDGLLTAYAMAGMKDEALTLADSLVSGANPWHFMALAQGHALLGNREEAFHWLEKARDSRHAFYPWIGKIPGFDPIKDDPRFAEMVADLDLPKGG